MLVCFLSEARVNMENSAIGRHFKISEYPVQKNTWEQMKNEKDIDMLYICLEEKGEGGG